MRTLLLSQKIASDVNFLKKDKKDKRIFNILRDRIIKSHKLIVPLELLNLDRIEKTSLFRDIDFISGAEANKYYDERAVLYKKYSKLPFESLFIENETGGFFCNGDGSGNFVIIMVEPEGKIVSSSTFVFNKDEEKPITHKPIHFGKELKEYNVDVSSFITALILEILLFLNTKNVTKHVYIPNKHENKSIPINVLPFYTYKVLDIFHEKKTYGSLKEVIDFTKENKNSYTERRACIVRGHFKNRSTGIFWWSDFVRNKKNIDKGFVDKDYRLNV